MVGLAEGCFNKTVPYTMERKQFGRRIWDFQVGELYGNTFWSQEGDLPESIK